DREQGAVLESNAGSEQARLDMLAAAGLPPLVEGRSNRESHEHTRADIGYGNRANRPRQAVRPFVSHDPGHCLSDEVKPGLPRVWALGAEACRLAENNFGVDRRDPFVVEAETSADTGAIIRQYYVGMLDCSFQ